MKMSRKNRISWWRLVLFAVLAVSMLNLGALAEAVRANDVVIVTFWGDWGGEGANQFIVMADAFNASQDKIEVEYVVQEDMITKFLTASTSGNAPDIMFWDRWRTAQYAPRGVMMPINDYMERDGISPDEFYQEALRELSLGEDIYGLPLTVDCRALFYNKTLLEEAGVEPPTTWEELEQAAITLTVWDGERLERAGFSLEDIGLFSMYLRQAGGTMVTEDGSKTNFNNEKGLEVLAFWDRLINEDRVYQVGFEEGLGAESDAFVTGKVAMLYTGPWMITTYQKYGQDLDFGIVPPPAGPRGDRGSMMGGFGLIIPTAAEHPDEAWEFMKWWLAEPENALLWAKTSFNIPGNLAAVQDPFFQDDPFWKPILDTLEFAKIRPPYAGYAPMEIDALIPALQLFRLGELSAEDTLSRAQQDGDGILELENLN
jgi:multiple sugar transport system substrate-binding protein